MACCVGAACFWLFFLVFGVYDPAVLLPCVFGLSGVVSAAFLAVVLSAWFFGEVVMGLVALVVQLRGA
ncbi:hypothetical protein SAMN02927923_03440 [Microvirga guangxiensis]|uniref:Uncharacterized protein n=1 Tax=Microvirga guangxiensis TaxID=549386 RepID=A0A1G5KMW1_9HYPH|nr:hypothetical protein SAMN02927923_03440 [Microvirga guangxiensis]